MKEERGWNDFFGVEGNFLSEEHRETVTRLAKEQYFSCRRRTRPDFWPFLGEQIRFMAWKIWVLQGTALFVLCLIHENLYATGNGAWYVDHLPAFLGACGILTVMSAFPILRRSARCRMLETELATAFSAGKMVLAQLLFIGTGDAGMLTVMFVIARRSRASGSLVFVSLVIPFLTAAAACMMLWARVDWSAFGRLGTAVCLLPFAGICWLAEKHAEAFTFSRLPVWICYAAVCLAVMIWQSERLVGQESFERIYL